MDKEVIEDSPEYARIRELTTEIIGIADTLGMTALMGFAIKLDDTKYGNNASGTGTVEGAAVAIGAIVNMLCADATPEAVTYIRSAVSRAVLNSDVLESPLELLQN